MYFAKRSIFIFFTLWIFSSIAQAMEKSDGESSSRYLSRYQSVSDIEGFADQETCRYYSQNNIISLNQDPVYSPKYRSLNGEITDHLRFLDKTATKQGSKDVNFMTVILFATGTEGNTTKRVFANIYANEGQFFEEKGTIYDGTNGQAKIMIDPDIFISKRKKTKILIFSSANQSHEKKAYFVHEFKTQFETIEPQDRYTLFNRDSFSDKSEVKDVFYANAYASNSHTESLWLSALQTLPQNTFQKLLPDGYDLTYYEIHFISNLDACWDCSIKIYEGTASLKSYFGSPDLFIFYHSNMPYAKWGKELPKSIPQTHPYSIKFMQDPAVAKWQYISAAFWYHPCCNLYIKQPTEEEKKLHDTTLENRKNSNFTVPPLYYFAIIHSLDGKTITIKKEFP